MAVIYIACEVLLRKNIAASQLGYVGAFAEAAMVGALADWFAVTALFHHPLGLKIPHTDLIEKSKKNIGDNLGKFVTENFLNPSTIRPYISKIKVSEYIAEWLEKGGNRKKLLAELANIIRDILQESNDETIATFIANKGKDLADSIAINKTVAAALQYLLDKNEHEKILSYLLNKAKYYIYENEETVRQRVKKESGFLVPGFVDNIIANRITVGIVNYLHEIEQTPDHPIRKEISQQLYGFAKQMREENKWETELDKLKENLLSQQSLQQYAAAIWTHIKAAFINELNTDNSKLMQYADSHLLRFTQNLKTNETMQNSLDAWFRLNAYRFLLRNTDNVSTLISNTVGDWQGRELSQKLELEVGKDLQYIRVNGTLVGGLVGLAIYIITQLL